jgi:pyruvate,water dikinase
VRVVAGTEAPVDRALLGGKGANLALLARAGMPVPSWLSVTTAVFASVEERVREEVSGLLRGLDARSQKDAERASAEIARAFQRAGLAAQDKALLLERFDALFGSEGDVAVRSSGVAEDSSERSFAGQMDTFLHVRRAALEERVLACFASAWSPRALLYRSLHAGANGSVALAVVVQRMVESRASGVLFTADPVTGDPTRAVISAGLGLGEGVVADKVETDTFEAELATGKILSRRLVPKRARVVRDRARGEGTVVEAVEASTSEGDAPALADDEVRALVALGRQVVERERAPQDMEWAIDAAGALHVLQTRPITTLGGHLTVLDSSNIVESYPGITLPLTFSFARSAYEATFRESSRTFGVPESVLVENRHVHAHLIALVEGRVYYDLLHFYRLFQLVPGFEGVLPAWEKALGLAPGMVPKAPEPTAWSRLLKGRILARTFGHFARLEANVERFLADFASVHEEFRALDLATLDSHELLLVYEDLARRLLGPYSISVVNDFFAQQLHELVAKLIARWELGDASVLRNDLFRGERGMESVEPVRSALAIAARVRKDPKARAALEREDAWSALREDPALRSLLDEHVLRFGDRTLEELKLETPPLDEDPRFLVATLRNLVASGTEIEALEERERGLRAAAEGRVGGKLAWQPLRFLVFSFVLERARRSVRFRENLRLARSRAFGMVKRVFSAIGRDLARRSVLEAPRDVFYLTVEEVTGAVRGSQPTRDLAALVAQRKREYAGHAERTLPARIVMRGPVLAARIESARPVASGALRGTGCSPGIARGRAKVVRAADPTLSVRGEILIAPMTDPGWVFLMVAARALVVERGSILSHTAIIGRELGIPTVVGVAGATDLIKDGDEVEVDGAAGTVRRL